MPCVTGCTGMHLPAAGRRNSAPSRRRSRRTSWFRGRSSASSMAGIPTNAWKLLTDSAELFPDAIIQMAVFKGSTRAVFLDRKTAAGPIDEQIEEAMLFVKRNIRLGSRIAGVYREDIYELPIDSIREMISNAVCHRSYVSPGSIQVAIYDDRLEVTSPGRLSPDLTMEQLKAGNSRVRNVAIGAAFQYMHIIERWAPAFRGSSQKPPSMDCRSRS